MATDSRGAIENVCKRHVEAGVIVAIEIKESDRSVSAVGGLKSPICRSVGHGPLVEGYVDLFASGDVVESLTIPE
jgi:hypothetical protein